MRFPNIIFRHSGTTPALICLFCSVLLNAGPAFARLDLSKASVERLDNGLTLIMLEDRTFPVASVQAVYRTGAKDDPAGRLGLAHFFEHMAFRGSKNFPGTGLTGEIYAVGGEWHGYTWLDLTTYFATVPKNELPLLLSIEADRMARLELRKEDIEAEQGAVLAEMNGYLNDPDTVLFDTLIATHFLTHPYRNNTIGYADDVRAITHEDVVEFYARHYAPQNAIIAIVGDFNAGEVRELVRKKFGKIKKKTRPRAPLTAESPRTGERRVSISIPSNARLFKIAWPAPAASHPDFPAFLVLQVLIGESSGVNFNQNDWGTPVGERSPLSAAATDLRSWVIPTAERYAFVVSGSAARGDDASKIEAAIQKVLDEAARKAPGGAALEEARRKALAALAFDVETTEDAAHQLAYFAGIGAFGQLLALESDIAKVSADDVRAVAAKYLKREQRTIAWLEPGPPPGAPEAQTAAEPSARKGAPALAPPAAPPAIIAAPNRPPVFLQQSSLSETVTVAALLAGRIGCSLCRIDEPAYGLTTLSASAVATKSHELPSRLEAALEFAPTSSHQAASSEDPLTHLEEVFASYVSAIEFSPAPLAISVSGKAEETLAAALSLLQARRIQDQGGPNRYGLPDRDVEITLTEPKAQHAVGYAALAPAASDADALATEIALYVLSHGYSGRLGEKAIARRGLAYYIDARYRAGKDRGIVAIAAGVDPDKVDPFRALLKSEIARLSSEPPSDVEIAEAKRHLLGRKISAAQSNEEIAGALLFDFLAVGRPESVEEFSTRLQSVTREDVLDAVDALQKGAVVTVRGAGVE